MFTTLLESRAMRTRRTGGTTLSAMLHGGLIAAGVTVGAHKPPATMPDKPHRDPVVFVPMTPRPHPQAASTHATTSSVPRPPEVVDIVIAPPTITPVGLP